MIKFFFKAPCEIRFKNLARGFFCFLTRLRGLRILEINLSKFLDFSIKELIILGSNKRGLLIHIGYIKIYTIWDKNDRFNY